MSPAPPSSCTLGTRSKTSGLRPSVSRRSTSTVRRETKQRTPCYATMRYALCDAMPSHMVMPRRASGHVHRISMRVATSRCAGPSCCQVNASQGESPLRREGRPFRPTCEECCFQNDDPSFAPRTFVLNACSRPRDGWPLIFKMGLSLDACALMHYALCIAVGKHHR